MEINDKNDFSCERISRLASVYASGSDEVTERCNCGSLCTRGELISIGFISMGNDFPPWFRASNLFPESVGTQESVV